MTTLSRPGHINLKRCPTFGTDDETIEKMQSAVNLVLDSPFASTNETTISIP